MRIPLKEGIGGETRGDRGETEGDFMDNSITVFLISWVCKLDRGFHPQTVHNHPPQTLAVNVTVASNCNQNARTASV